jgi:hypothetical protein
LVGPSVAALVIATLFAGAALYISLVEHPARLTLEDTPLLAQWRSSYKRALPIQAGLAVLGGITGLVVWRNLGDWRWLAGGLALLANWPFTLLIIMPTNKRLLELSRRKAGDDSRMLLRRWGSLHNVRSVLGSLSALLFAWAVLANAP